MGYELEISSPRSGLEVSRGFRNIVQKFTERFFRPHQEPIDPQIPLEEIELVEETPIVRVEAPLVLPPTVYAPEFEEWIFEEPELVVLHALDIYRLDKIGRERLFNQASQKYQDPELVNHLRNWYQVVLEADAPTGEQVVDTFRPVLDISPDVISSKRPTYDYTIGVPFLYPKRPTIRGVRELSDEELDDLIKKRAQKNKKGDEELIADYKTMINSIRENPSMREGSGVKKLAMDRFMTIDRVVYPLWEYSAFLQTGQIFSSPFSTNTRIIFVRYEKDDKKMIVLDGIGIYTHQEFDRKYKS